MKQRGRIVLSLCLGLLCGCSGPSDSAQAGAGADGSQVFSDAGTAGTGSRADAASPSTGAGASDAPGLVDRPNFIVILGEAEGFSSTSALQDPKIKDSKSEFVETPNLDSIANQGMRFPRFYAPSPRCMPTRAALFTGKSPAQLHMTFIPEGNKDGAAQGSVVAPMTETNLPTDETTIADLLEGRGYAAAHFGKWHAGRTDPAEYGFDASDGATANGGPANVEHPNPTEVYGMADRGIAFMQAKVDAGTPFYLQISNYNSRFEEDALPETYAAEAQRLAGADARDIGLAAATRDFDSAVGKVLEEVKRLGIEDRTYIVFTADHGAQGENANEPLTQGKGTVWEGGVRVPLFVRGPGIDPNTVAYARATGVDLFSTFAELAGVSTLPAGVEGGSLVPVLSNPDLERVARPREELVVHFPHYDKDPLGPASTIILGDYKLIRTYEDGAFRLFDLNADVAEQRDLSATMPDKVRELDERLTDYLTTVGAQLPTRR